MHVLHLQKAHKNMFGRFGAGFDDPTDAEFGDLFGDFDSYIEDNTNVESRPLDLGPVDDGINIRTEDDALDTGRPSLTRMRFRRCKRTRTSRSRT